MDAKSHPIDAQNHPIDAQKLPNDTQRLPNDTQKLPNDTQRLPNDTWELPNYALELSKDIPWMQLQSRSNAITVWSHSRDIWWAACNQNNVANEGSLGAAEYANASRI